MLKVEDGGMMGGRRCGQGYEMEGVMGEWGMSLNVFWMIKKCVLSNKVVVSGFGICELIMK